MAKPVIVTRLGKGSELTFQEGDDNFTNLQNATISIGGTSGTPVPIDLNGSITVVGANGLSTTAAGGGLIINLDDTAVTAGSYTKASVTVDAQGRITAASNGSADFTQSDARTSISVTDAGGEGSLDYNNSTGVITYTGPSFTGLEVTSAKNQNNGYAGLDANGKVASAQLPSYVDDVIEAADFASLPETGETGKIYVALDNGKIYRWSGSAYVEISASPGSTDSVTEGTTNLYFTTQRARDSFSASTGITLTNGAIATTITQYTDSLARSAISVTDSGGDGSLSYSSSTGVITYTGPSASEVRAHFSAGSGISITDGVIANTQSAGIANVVDDTTPQLGGYLDANSNEINNLSGISATATNPNINLNPYFGSKVIVNGNFETTGNIVSSSNGNIELTPNGSGNVHANSINLRVGTGSLFGCVTSNGAHDLILNTNNGGINSGSIIITDGVNGNITILPNGTGASSINNLQYQEKVHALGTTSGTVAPNVTNGNVQTITLNGNLTLNAFTSPQTGQNLTLIVKQDATGSRTLTSTMKFAGGTKTLTTAANSTDIISVFYDGTTYWASLSTDFK